MTPRSIWFKSARVRAVVMRQHSLNNPRQLSQRPASALFRLGDPGRRSLGSAEPMPVGGTQPDSWTTYRQEGTHEDRPGFEMDFLPSSGNSATALGGAQAGLR